MQEMTIRQFKKSKYLNVMLEFQGGVCGLCKQVENRPYKKQNGDVGYYELCIDHNHKTGRIRGLLCAYCNSLLGQVEKRGETKCSKKREALQVSDDDFKYWVSNDGIWNQFLAHLENKSAEDKPTKTTRFIKVRSEQLTRRESAGFGAEPHLL